MLELYDKLSDITLFSGTNYNRIQLITHPELFKFHKMANVLNHFDSVWCNVKRCEVNLQHVTSPISTLNKKFLQ